jgi:hypothetical protein
MAYVGLARCNWAIHVAQAKRVRNVKRLRASPCGRLDKELAFRRQTSGLRHSLPEKPAAKANGAFAEQCRLKPIVPSSKENPRLAAANQQRHPTFVCGGQGRAGLDQALLTATASDP